MIPVSKYIIYVLPASRDQIPLNIKAFNMILMNYDNIFQILLPVWKPNEVNSTSKQQN